MKKNVRIASALGTALGLMAASGMAHAEAPKLSEVLESSGITATGYVDASAYHFSTASGAFHQFDTNHSTFALDQAALTLAFQPKDGFGALVNVIAGQDAKAINTAEDSTGNDSSFNVTQAFLQYASGPFTVIAGKYLTLAGAEVIAATGNTNYSRSLLFTNLEPLTHTGVRATVAPSDIVSFSLGINNGWNVVSDSNAQKTFEGSVSITPSPVFSLALTGYFGNEGSGSTGATNLIDVVATVHATDMLSFVLNYDNVRVKDVPVTGVAPARTEDLKADGLAFYTNLSMSEQWRLSLRLEQVKLHVNTGTVVGVVDETIKEGTLTLAYMPTKNAEVRFEVRQDKSSGTTVLSGSTVVVDTSELFTDFSSGNSTDKQTEFAIQGIYKF